MTTIASCRTARRETSRERSPAGSGSPRRRDADERRPCRGRGRGRRHRRHRPARSLDGERGLDSRPPRPPRRDRRGSTGDVARTLASSVAKLTVASTPSSSLRRFSIRAAHETHVIPSICKSTSKTGSVVCSIDMSARVDLVIEVGFGDRRDRLIIGLRPDRRADCRASSEGTGQHQSVGGELRSDRHGCSIPTGGILQPCSNVGTRPTRTPTSSACAASRARSVVYSAWSRRIKYCIDVLTQVSAATKALQSVALGLLDDHLRHCVAGAVTSGDAAESARLTRRGDRGDRAPRQGLTPPLPDLRRQAESARPVGGLANPNAWADARCRGRSDAVVVDLGRSAVVGEVEAEGLGDLAWTVGQRPFRHRRHAAIA